MRKKLYMHTFKGMPAYYWDKKQIVYGIKALSLSNMCKNLYQIRKEEELSTTWRKKKGFSPVDFEYGYVIVYI